ncbi:hypothetical protein BDB00DRAFT_942748 [Zychaea mexicana]|uniref:uncharacterized protein n=1 Tax=Zychaea mexicana TaxID=64656 RepID=UPI0022FEF203|nr:uncharacterized protein BDB00DRAFT_942748 [Zychaea mexicana]KAI9485008.1 hypothetical protein BDB00DRAFT_942748 [Zychaea mexicana]
MDLVSTASTCRRLNALASDRSIWSGPVNVILDRSSHDYTKTLAMTLARRSTETFHTTCVTMAIEQTPSASAIELLKNLFERQQKKDEHDLTDINIYVPSAMHMPVLENALLCYEGLTRSITLRDAANHNGDNGDQDGQDTSSEDNNHADNCFAALPPCLGSSVREWLTRSRQTLTKIDLPSCPLDWLPSDLPQLESLTILAAASLNAHQLRQALPRLKHLTIHLEHADHFSFVRPLLTNKLLYPWIESLEVICRDDLKLSLDQNELTECLMTIKGLSRVNAGWDMVAVDAL